MSSRERPWLDELHKAPRWKTGLKGIYDLRHDEADIIVTGSARPDLFRQGGDGLPGRYFPFRLHPLSVGEVEGAEPASPDTLLDRLCVASTGDESSMQRLLPFHDSRRSRGSRPGRRAG